VVFCLFAGMVVACTEEDTPESRAPAQIAGAVNVAVSADALVVSDISYVKVTVTGDPGEEGFPITEVMNYSAITSGFFGNITDIPAGNGRSFLAEAFGDDTETSDAGEADVLLYTGQVENVTITSGGTATVLIYMHQAVQPDPWKNTAPMFDSLVISDGHVAPGEMVNITVAASDPDPEDGLTYAWGTSANGVYSDNDGETAQWSSGVAATYSLSVTATDNNGAIATISFNVEVYAVGSANVSIDINSTPVVDGIIATPTYLEVNYRTQLSLSAHDDDTDSLSYAWSITAGGCTGRFGYTTGTGAGQLFNPDPNRQNPEFLLLTGGADDNSTCTLTVVVTDPAGPNQGSTTGSITIHTGPPAFTPVYQDTDADNDSYTLAEGDCDDANAAINPGAVELCTDGVDNDCDGLVDDLDVVDCLPQNLDAGVDSGTI